MEPLLLQLADSAFPAGQFAHSFGLEALVRLGHADGEGPLVARLEELVWQTAWGALPFLGAAHAGEAVAADHAADTFLSGHVANRASRAQGRAFLVAADALLDHPTVRALPRTLPFRHAAVAFGAALACAPVALDDARWLFLFGAVRGALSAAVRLGVTGPLRAQRLLRDLHPLLGRALDETRALVPDDAATVAPLGELAQGAHDRLYARLFQS